MLDLRRARDRRIAVIGAMLLLVVFVSGIVAYRSADQRPATGLKVDWGGSEGHPSCVYDPKNHTVEAKITIDGRALRRDTLTVTVTAYADENTTQAVGSSGRSVHVEGTVHERLLVTIPVGKAPLVDVDGETACGRTVTYAHPNTPN